MSVQIYGIAHEETTGIIRMEKGSVCLTLFTLRKESPITIALHPLQAHQIGSCLRNAAQCATLAEVLTNAPCGGLAINFILPMNDTKEEISHEQKATSSVEGYTPPPFPKSWLEHSDTQREVATWTKAASGL